MDALEFREFVSEMEKTGKIRTGYGSIEDLAAQLDLHRDSLRRFIIFGTKSRMTDFACAALLAGLEPYGKKPEKSDKKLSV